MRGMPGSGDLPKTADMSIRRHIRSCRAVYSFAAAFALALAVTGSAPAGFSPVSITSVGLTNGQTLSGSIAWTAQISGVPNRVEFAIDGTVLWTEPTSPFTFNGHGDTLATTTLANGSHTFTVTAYQTPGKGQSVSAGVTATVANAPAVQPTAPSSSAPPSISGSAVVGQTLTASNGSWAGTTPMSYGYQWKSCDASGASCSPVSGATASTFVLPSSAVGARIVVSVTASNTVGSTSASSTPTAAVGSGTSPSTAPSSSSPPSISGSGIVGQTLIASTGTWAGTTPMTYAYQWQQCDSVGANCSLVASATSASYVIGAALAGRTARVTVSASNVVGSASAFSAATAVAATSPTGTPTYESQTAYLNTPKPDLSNAIVVSSAAQFVSAMASAAAGQTYDVLGTVKITSQFNSWNRVVAGGVVNVVLEPGMTFAGDSRTGYNAVHLQDSGGWRIWGGTLANPYGGGIHVYSIPGPFTWTGFTVGQVGGTGLSVFPVPTTLTPSGNISNLTLSGAMGSSSENLSYDPHAEKGTGLHCSNIADPPYGGGGGIVQNSTFAVDCLNQATGAAVEINSNRSSNVVIFARATHLGFALPGTTWPGYATNQVAGNVIQLWGGSSGGRLDIRYAEGNDIQGRILETNGVSSGADISQVSLDYGRATGPILKNPVLSKVAYTVKGGLKLVDALPLP
jgi:hypothetical protein